jgi:lipopolysaccharide/colanic/teichoic acid biosynthesis glycosyltransferase
MKRLFDVMVAGFCLLLFSPVLALVASAIAITDAGPIIYRHQRVGRNGVPFYILKFRTMRQVSSIQTDLTYRHDPRVTPLGRILRACKIDEIPQFVNVLRGDMSLVGPRPESPRYVQHYTPRMREALAVRPGITGPASVLYSHQEQLLPAKNVDEYYVTVLMPQKMEINLYYVQHQSFWLDMKILRLTVIALFKPIPATALIAPEAWSAFIASDGLPAAGPDGVEADLSLAELAQYAERPAQPRERVPLWRRIPRGLKRRLNAYGAVMALDMLAVALAFAGGALLYASDHTIPSGHLRALLVPSVAAALIYGALSYLGGLHRRLWQYATLFDDYAVMRTIGGTALTVGALRFAGVSWFAAMPLTMLVAGALLAAFALGSIKAFPRIVGPKPPSAEDEAPVRPIRVLIVGAGRAGAGLAARFMQNSTIGYEVVAFLDDDGSKWRRRIHDKQVFGPIETVDALVRLLKVDVIAIALPSATKERLAEVIDLCERTPAHVYTMQGLLDIASRLETVEHPYIELSPGE